MVAVVGSSPIIRSKKLQKSSPLRPGGFLLPRFLFISRMAKRETPLEKTGASEKPVRKRLEPEIENSFGKSEWNAAFADL